MESIYTARNSQQLPFTSINNTTANPPGIFTPGPQPLLCAGPDGIVGTADDVACTAPDTGVACPGGVECLVLPGPDGILGTADDVTQSLSNFTRTITFNQVQLPASEGGDRTRILSPSPSPLPTLNLVGRHAPIRVNGLISSYH